MKNSSWILKKLKQNIRKTQKLPTSVELICQKSVQKKALNKYNVLLIKGQRFAILNQYFLKDFREKTRKGKLHHCSHLCSMMIMKERMVSHILRIPEQLKASPMLADLPRPISELCFAARSDVYCYMTDFWQNSF